MSMLRKTLVTLAAVGAFVALSVGPAGAYPTSGPLSASDTSVRPGDSIVVSGGGFEPGTSVQVTIASTPTVLATVAANGAGSFSTTVTIPSSTEPGTHTLSASGAAPAGDSLVLSTTITVEGFASSIAFTGGNILALVGIALAGVAVGTLLVAVTRRRSSVA